ncbi:MAG: trypsin-like serine peptidase [Thermoanaerobaculia bacterium]
MEHLVEGEGNRGVDHKYDDPNDGGRKQRGMVFLSREKLTPLIRPANGDSVSYDQSGDAPRPEVNAAVTSTHAGWIANWNEFAGAGAPALKELTSQSQSWTEVELPGGRISSIFRCEQETLARAEFVYGEEPVRRHYAHEAVVTLEYPNDTKTFTLRSRSFDDDSPLDLVFEWGDETTFEILIGNGSAMSLENVRNQTFCGHDHESLTDFEFEVLHDVVDCARDRRGRLPVPRVFAREIRQIPCIVSSITSTTLPDEAVVTPDGRSAKNVARIRDRVSGPLPAATESLQTDVLSDSFITEVPAKIGLLAERTNRMCRFVLNGSARTFATGFLIGPDLVMTAAHAFFHPDGTLMDPLRAANLTAEFGQLSIDVGRILSNGKVTCPLAEDWAVDPVVVERTAQRDIDVLDYAIVRLARRVGDETIAPGGMARGFFDWPPDIGNLPLLKPGVFVRILQHVGDESGVLRASLGMIQTVAMDRLRVGYTASTRDASSGAAVMDQDFNLVALHVAGSDEHFPRQNQGLPVRWILKTLEARRIAEEAELRAS